MVNYAKKFGFSKELLEKWQDKEIFLKGKKDINIILVHGWSSIIRQVLPLGKQLNKKGYWVSIPKLLGHSSRPEDLESVTGDDWLKNIIYEIKKQKQKNKTHKIILVGISMGGNLCLLASLKEKVDGIVLIGTPVHLQGHWSIKIFSIIMPLFKKYVKKKTPKGVIVDKSLSYQYFPTKNMKEVLLVIKKAVFSLYKVTSPILILQAKNDFFVTKYSPWVIYKNVGSKFKETHWIHTESENHVPQENIEIDKVVEKINNFIKKL